MLKSGTTILAFRYKDGVIVAGDRRMTDNHYHHDDYVKVEDVDNLTLIACAGTVAAVQLLAQTLVSVREQLEEKIRKPIFVDGQAELLKNILIGNFFRNGMAMYWLNYIAVPVLGGFDPKMDKGRIFGYDEAGGIYERPDYVAVGSGQVNAETLLDEKWDPKLELENAEELAVRAILRASRDNYTAPPVLAPVTVFHASKGGVCQMDERKALEVAWDIFYKDAERRGDSTLPEIAPDTAREAK